MAVLRIGYEVSREAALRAGKTLWGVLAMRGDVGGLTPAQRETLIRQADAREPMARGDFYTGPPTRDRLSDWDYVVRGGSSAVPTLEAVAERLDGIAAARAELEGEEVVRLERREALKAWGVERGSELLRLRILDGKGWLGLARQEWADVHMDAPLLSRGFARAGSEDGLTTAERDMPTQGELEALANARRVLEPVDAECSLIWVRYPGSPDGQVEVRVAAVAPDGEACWRFYALPHEVRS